ncbi:MAG: HNH endonuclease, partial [Chloroflexi bacterium]|nr:HNH endonuclease [Chloroflexota bacterium]
EVDHLVAFSQGGSNHISNLAAAHSRCNRQKHARNIFPVWMKLNGWAPPPVPGKGNPQSKGIGGWWRRGLASDAAANWIKGWHSLNPHLGDGVRKSIPAAIDRQNGCCNICRRQLPTPQDRQLHLYHLVPRYSYRRNGVWQGEFKDASSLALAHPDCNLSHGLRRLVPKFAANLQVSPPETGCGFVSTIGCVTVIALFAAVVLLATVSGQI